MACSHNDERGSDVSRRGSEGRTADGRGGTTLRLDNSLGAGLEGLGLRHRTSTGQREGSLRPVATASGIDWLADDREPGRIARGRDGGSGDGRGPTRVESRRLRDVEHMVNPDGGDTCSEWQQHGWQQRQQPQDRGRSFRAAPNRPCPTNGYWGDADWLFCRDGKWRPVEPGSFPLVDGTAFRVGSGSTFEGKSRQGMLKGYGNAIDAEATIDFILTYFGHESYRARLQARARFLEDVL